MTRLRPRTCLVIAVVALLIGFLPLRLAVAWAGVSDRGVSARAVGGTIWSGRLDGLRVGALDVGTLDVGHNPFALLAGRASMRFDRVDDAAAPFGGRIVRGFGGFAVQDVAGSVAGGSIAGLPIERVTFVKFDAQFNDERCLRAGGEVRAELGLRIMGLSLRHGLAGTARCEGGALLLPLAGESGMERATLRLWPDRRYQLQIGVSDPDPLVAAALARGGFVNRGGGWVREVRGQF